MGELQDSGTCRGASGSRLWSHMAVYKRIMTGITAAWQRKSCRCESSHHVIVVCSKSKNLR